MSHSHPLSLSIAPLVPSMGMLEGDGEVMGWAIGGSPHHGAGGEAITSPPPPPIGCPSNVPGEFAVPFPSACISSSKGLEVFHQPGDEMMLSRSWLLPHCKEKVKKKC